MRIARRKISQRFINASFALVLALSTATASVPYLFSQGADAEAVSGHVVVNEVFPAPISGREWIELYNPTASSVDLTGWTIKDKSHPAQRISGTIAAGGFATFDVTKFNNRNDTVTLSSPAGVVDTVAYRGVSKVRSYARIYDANDVFEVRASASVTKNASNGSAPASPVIIDEVETETIPPTTPQITNITNGQYFTSTPIRAVWTAATDASGIERYQVEYIYSDGHTFVGGPYRDVPGDTTFRDHQPDVTEQGGVTIRVRAIDRVGNVGAWSSPVQYYYDATAPAAPTGLSWKTDTGKTIANNGSTSESGGAAQWQASSGTDIKHYVYRYWNDIVGNPYKVGNEYTTTTAATSLPGVFNQGEGVHHFCVAAVDHAGNTSACSQFTIEYDATAPSVPMRTFPSNNSFTADNTFWFDWDDVPGVVSYEVQFSQSSSTDANKALNVGVWSGDASHGQPTESRAWSEGATGTWYWQVRAVDAAGNKSAWTIPWKLTIDLVAPVAEIVNPLDGTYVNGTVSLKGKVTDSNPMNSHFRIEGPNKYLKTETKTNGLTLHQFDWNTAGLRDGVYTIYFETRDKANNKDGSISSLGVSVDKIVVNIDRTAPNVPTGTVTTDVNGDIVSAVLNATDNADGSGIDYIVYTTDGTTPSATNGDRISSGISVAVNPDATTVVKAVAYDKAGNSSEVFTATYNSAPQITNEAAVTPTATSIVLEWVTDHPATSRVVYDTVSRDGLDISSFPDGSNYGYAFSTAEDTNKVTKHSVTITGLAPGTTYYFRTVSKGSPENVSSEVSSVTKKETRTDGTTVYSVNTNSGVQAATTGNNGTARNRTVGVASAQDAFDTETNSSPATLGTSTRDESSQRPGEVLAATDSQQGCGKFMGLCWYWWAPIGVAAIGVIWIYLAARNRRSGPDKDGLPFQDLPPRRRQS